MNETTSKPGQAPIRRWLESPLVPAAIATAVAGVSLLLPLAKAALWAPYELSTADLSRRIAVGLHGATQLGIDPSQDGVPTLQELGKGQLPFSSVALGFQALGLGDWTGRLPLALWALAGVAAVYQLVRHLADRTAAVYSAVALSTMPLYFLQARTLLGDAVVLASVAIATSGLALLTFGTLSRRSRVVWALLSLLGLASGFLSRGILLAVACPALGVGLAWWIRGPRRHQSSGAGNWAVGAASLALGSLALGAGYWAMTFASDAMALELLGTEFQSFKKLATHDSVLHQLGHGLFPWSAAAPFLLAIALSSPQRASKQDNDPLRPDPLALPVCLGCVFAIGWLLHGLTLPRLGPLPNVGTFAVAAWVGVGFRRLETEPFRTRLLALGMAALLLLLAKDLKDDPGQAMNAFAVGATKSPASFRATAETVIRYAAPLCLLSLALWLSGLPSRAPSPEGSQLSLPARLLPSFRRSNGGVWRWVARTTRSRLWKPMVFTTLGLMLLAALLLVDQYAVDLTFLHPLGPLRQSARFGFLALPLFFLVGASSFLARDLLGGLFAWLPWPRARLAWISFAAFGLVMSLGYYPALAQRLSPRGVFSSLAELASPGEPLNILGTARKIAPFYTSRKVETSAGPAKAFEWLTTPGDKRRWLVLPGKNLAQLNSLHRKHTTPPANLPLLFGKSGEVSLASDRLLDAERNLSPLEPWVQAVAPAVQHPLAVKLTKQLQCLGWSLTSLAGRPIDKARTGRDYQLRIHWKVLAPIRKAWKVFIHIDGSGRRYNGDHEQLGGDYPMRFWNVGDYITDSHPVRFEREYAGATYEVYFGLWTGKKRLEVVEGAHTEDRIHGGKLKIH